jgi:hypothetical protein
VEDLASKFLAVTANGVDLPTVYAATGNRDLSTIMFRVGDKARLYRSTSSSGFTYQPEVWAYLFSNAKCAELLDNPDHGLDAYRYFQRKMANEPRFSELPEWKKALAFYMGTQVYRNGHAVCRAAVGVPHKDIQRVTSAMRPEFYVHGVAAVINHMGLGFLDQPDFRIVLRNPGADQMGAATGGENDATRNQFQSSATSIGDMVAAVKEVPTKRWDLTAKKVYRSNPLVNEAAEQIGDFSPLNCAFQQLVGDGFKQTDLGESEDARWVDVLSLVDFAPVGDVMNTPEMQQFLLTTAEEISAKDFQGWTAQDAVKKLIIAHAPRWQQKWAKNYVVDESVVRAVNQHLRRFPEPSDDLRRAVNALDPRLSE